MAKIAEMTEKVNVPEGVNVKIENNNITVKGQKGELTRTFSHPKIKIKLEGTKVEVTSKEVRRKDKVMIGTFAAHINNMMKGVTQGYEYKMKTVFSHFPIKTSVEGNTFIIQNFLGERSPRKAQILDGVKVVAKAEEITITGIDKEKVGQTVANIELATRIKDRDVRVFQDGVYRTSKGGK